MGLLFHRDKAAAQSNVIILYGRENYFRRVSYVFRPLRRRSAEIKPHNCAECNFIEITKLQSSRYAGYMPG